MIEAELRGWLPVVGVALPEDQVQHILEEAEHVLGPYVTSDGRVRLCCTGPYRHRDEAVAGRERRSKRVRPGVPL